VGRFSDELETSINRLYGGVDPSGVSEMARREIKFVTDAHRLGEAQEIEEVASAFVAAELHPRPDDRGLGVRGGAANRFPALGIVLDKKNPPPGSKESNGLADGLMFALACGYSGGLAVESALPHSFAAGVPPERVWAITVANFRADGARKLGVSASIIENLEKFGQDAITDALKVADIGGWGTRKAPLVGRYYAHAGFFMRVAQTTMELPYEVDALAREGREHWPYEKYLRSARA
jgi:hypothetical protein